MDAPQLQAIAEAVAQAVAAGQAQAQPQQPAAAAAPFALTPGRLNPTEAVDYSTRTGQAIFAAATASLPHKFDAESKTVNQFCEDLRDRAIKAGWGEGAADILTIPDADGNNRNLIANYGQLTPEDIRAHVATYIAAQGRRAQNAVQMYHCIMESLTEEGKNKVLAETSKYTVQNELVGPLLFKLLIQKAIVDTRATASHMREQLTSLDAYMATVNSNVAVFNQHVKVNVEGLHARGQTTDDLMTNLFKGYLAASDKKFVSYIEIEKNKYDDGEDVTWEGLMAKALNKYTVLKQANQWNALSHEEEQIVALTSEVQSLKDNNLKLSKAVKKAGKKNKSKSTDDKDDKTKSKKKGKKKKGDDAWKAVAPKPGEPETKIVNDKEFKWCKYHSAWVMHDPEGDGPNACRKRLQMERDAASQGEQAGSSSRARAAYSAISAILQDEE